MSKSNAFETSILQRIFENADVPNIGDAGGLRGSVGAGSLYLSLHTADPGEAGNQGTSEATYTGYARVAVARSAAAWTVTADQVLNDAPITFPECTGGSNTVTHFGIGTAASGAGTLLYYGVLTQSLAVSLGITPSFAAGQVAVNEA